jgi:cell division septation protein DedD
MDYRRNARSNRQVIYFFLGFLILFVLTFGLGVILGKGLGGSKVAKSPEFLRKEVVNPQKTLEPIIKESLSLEQTPTPVEEIKNKEKLEIAKNEEEKTLPPAPIDEPIKSGAKKEGTIKRDIAVAPTIETEGKYTIQIGAFQNEEIAKKIVDELKSKGYDAFIKTVEISGKGTWHRVRIGTFKTREEAMLYGDKLKSLEPTIKSAVIKINN